MKAQQQNLLSGEHGTFFQVFLLFGRMQKKDAEQAHDGISMSNNSLHCEDLEPGEVHEVTLVLT